MKGPKPGDLIAVLNKSGYFYYFLVLSESVFFGCQWAYVFHLKSTEQKTTEELLSTFGNGFYALVDFNKSKDDFLTNTIGTVHNYYTYDFDSLLKTRIDEYEGGHKWYIYSKNFKIMQKKAALESHEYRYPIASGMHLEQAMSLVDKKWLNEQIVTEEGGGQFPI